MRPSEPWTNDILALKLAVMELTQRMKQMVDEDKLQLYGQQILITQMKNTIEAQKEELFEMRKTIYQVGKVMVERDLAQNEARQLKREMADIQQKNISNEQKMSEEMESRKKLRSSYGIIKASVTNNQEALKELQKFEYLLKTN